MARCFIHIFKTKNFASDAQEKDFGANLAANLALWFLYKSKTLLLPLMACI